jgi:hypothetical protein
VLEDLSFRRSRGQSDVFAGLEGKVAFSFRRSRGQADFFAGLEGKSMFSLEASWGNPVLAALSLEISTQ